MRKVIVGGIVAAVLSVGLAPVAASAAELPVSGIVTLDGAPVAATEVGWFDPHTGASGETATAADGSYTLSVADGHPYVLYAGLDHNNKGRWLPLGGDNYLGSFIGASGVDYLYQSLTAFTAPTTQNIALTHPGSIVGKVKGLAKQRVTLKSPAGQVIKHLRASSTGRYEFSGLVPGTYRLSAFAPFERYEEYESKDIVVTVGAVTRHSPKLTRTGTVTGIVTVGGKPAKDILVSVANVSIENGTNTDANGRYTVENVPAGRAELWFTGQGTIATSDYAYRRYQKHSKIRVTSGKTSTLNVSAPKPTLLTATVVPTKGAKDITVGLIDSDGVRAVNHYQKVGKAASAVTVALPGIAAGRYTMVITDSTNKRYLKKKITLTYGRATGLGRVALSKKTVTLSGAASGGAGDVAFKNTYVLRDDSTITNGRYRITGIVPGTGSVSVIPAERTPTPYFTAIGYYKLRVKKSSTLDVATGGPLLGVITGTAAVNDYRVFSTFGISTGIEQVPLAGLGDERYNSVYVDDSKLVGEAEINGPSTYQLTDQHSGFKKDFISGSPYWFDLPGGSVSIPSTRGVTTDAGTVAFEVRR